MNPILTNYDKDVKGFYYDFQKKNPLLRVSLHANTVPPEKDADDWLKWSQGSRSTNSEWTSTTDAEGNAWNYNECFPEDSTGSGSQYGKQSLCNSILSEDFGITIANNWGDFSAGQQLENIFNGLKGSEAYLNEASKVFSKITSGIDNYRKDIKGDVDNSVSTILQRFSGIMKNASSKGANIVRRALVVQGTRFKYYTGTGIAFSNLNMKFTMFPDYFNGNFKTIEDQLKTILPYSVGKFIKFYEESNDSTMKDIAKEYLDKLGDAKDSAVDSLNKFLGWQVPPGGFKADLQYIDYVQPGTLMLKLGAYYCLKNLVIQDIQLNYSKHTMKYLDIESNKIKTCPMYCDISITLIPANKYSDKMLKEFVISRSSKLSNELTTLENDINDSLNS